MESSQDEHVASAPGLQSGDASRGQARGPCDKAQEAPLVAAVQL